MKIIIPILIILMIGFFILAMLVLPMEGGTMTPGSVQSPETTTNPYMGAFGTDCEALKSYMTYGRIGVRAGWFSECLYHYERQHSGYGLAMVVHPEQPEVSGMHNTVMYQIGYQEEEWSVLHEQFTYPKGRDAFVYMGSMAVLAIDYADQPSGIIMISYDRGQTWSTQLAFDVLMDYDVEAYPDLYPEVINSNEYSAVITFGWKADPADTDYMLINQFDVRAKAFISEFHRDPRFPTAPVEETTGSEIQ